jgi:hypothetical protein
LAYAAIIFWGLLFYFIWETLLVMILFTFIIFFIIYIITATEPHNCFCWKSCLIYFESTVIRVVNHIWNKHLLVYHEISHIFFLFFKKIQYAVWRKHWKSCVLTCTFPNLHWFWQMIAERGVNTSKNHCVKMKKWQKLTKNDKNDEKWQKVTKMMKTDKKLQKWWKLTKNDKKWWKWQKLIKVTRNDKKLQKLTKNDKNDENWWKW